jgi:hypothetical protein
MKEMGLTITFEAGDSYEDLPPLGGQETAEEAAKRRAQKRQDAVKQFQKAAQASTRGAIEPLVQQLLALCLQLRALGGSGTETGIPNKLREAADFLEDLAG